MTKRINKQYSNDVKQASENSALSADERSGLIHFKLANLYLYLYL
jgi:hypothetical protein